MKKKLFIFSIVFLIIFTANIQESRAQVAVADFTLATKEDVKYFTSMWENIKTFLSRIERGAQWVQQNKDAIDAKIDRAMMIYQNAEMIRHMIMNLKILGNPLDVVSDLLSIMGSIEDSRNDTLDLYEDSKELIPYAAIDDTYGAFKDGRWVPPVDPIAMNRKYDTLENAIRDYQKKAKRIKVAIQTTKNARERILLRLKSSDGFKGEKTEKIDGVEVKGVKNIAEREAARLSLTYYTENWHLLLKELEDIRAHVDLIEQRRENLDKKVKENVVNQAMVFHYRSIKNSSTRLMSGGENNSDDIGDRMVL